MKFTLSFFALLFCLTHIFGCLDAGESSIDNPKSDLKVISNGLVSMTIELENGGNITSFKMGDSEILKTAKNKKDLQWGSTVWISPQKGMDWSSPAFFNQNAFQLVSIDSTSIVIQSEKDDNSGCQLIKEFSIRAGIPGVDLVYKLKNLGNVARKVALKENTKVNYEGQTMFFPDSIWTSTEVNPIVPSESPTAVIEFIDTFQMPIKVFATLEKGINQYFYKNLIFTKSFPLLSGEEVAPGQAPLEIYLDKPNNLVELDVQGRYQNLVPGKTMEMKMRWSLAER